MYDIEGYNKAGRSSYGYDRAGFFRDGWNIDGTHLDGRLFDPNGFDGNGVHQETGTKFAPSGRKRFIAFLPNGNANGFGHDGLDVEGTNARGFGRNGLHESTGTRYDSDGLDKEGFDADGFNEGGYYLTHLIHLSFYLAPDPISVYKLGWHKDTRNAYSPEGFDFTGRDENGRDSTGMFWELDDA
ncbi:hypothetical protein [Cryobacterium sp. Y62]|uniref:hypothetical protein n=1 Tax=Cryobacterium sp. Y62 TaxID=2048284 RepID=UPI0011B09264|nr:hypothetical protein [Cryobacterium sp. Y62]